MFGHRGDRVNDGIRCGGSYASFSPDEFWDLEIDEKARFMPLE